MRPELTSDQATPGGADGDNWLGNVQRIEYLRLRRSALRHAEAAAGRAAGAVRRTVDQDQAVVVPQRGDLRIVIVVVGQDRMPEHQHLCRAAGVARRRAAVVDGRPAEVGEDGL